MRQRQNLTSCSLDEQSSSLDERDDEQSLHGEARRGVFAHLETPRGNCDSSQTLQPYIRNSNVYFAFELTFFCWEVIPHFMTSC